MVTHDDPLAPSSVPDSILASLDSPFKTEIVQNSGLENSQPYVDTNALIEKWERLSELLSEHLLFVTSFLTHDFSNRHNWETQKFTFTCLSLKILKSLNRLMEDLAFAHLENQILEKIISSRRNLLRACNKLLFDLGSFQEVVIYLFKCTLIIN